MKFPNILRGIVEGFGSKRLTAIVAGILGVFLAPVAQKYLQLPPTDLLPMLIGVVGLVVSFVVSQWHVDVKTGGATSTAQLLTLKAAQAAEKALPDGTTGDSIARAVVAALQEGAGETPPPAPAP